ncbi:MAG TPA: hypothetical protein VE077_07105 [Candidatus Methylomirabilis sp.]|nr:hypothetical protein [Candidatus Methylomirabilis sp.]
MATQTSFVLRGLYVLAGIVVILFSVAESSTRAVLYVPIIFGILLVVQGVTGA